MIVSFFFAVDMFKHCFSTQYHKLSSDKNEDCKVQKRKKNDRAVVDHNRSDIVDYDDIDENSEHDDDAALSMMVKPKKEKIFSVKSLVDRATSSLPKTEKKSKQGEKKIPRVKRDKVAEPKKSQKTKLEPAKSKKGKKLEKIEKGKRHVSKRQLEKFSREFMPINTTSGKSRYQKLKKTEK